MEIYRRQWFVLRYRPTGPWFLDKQNDTGEKKILKFAETGLNDPPQQSGRGTILKRMWGSAFTEAFQEDSASNTNSRNFAKRCHPD
jgi:hypothetical protein